MIPTIAGTADSAPRGSDAIVIAGFFALLTGTIEATAFLFDHLVLHHIVWVSTDVVWMAPAAYLVFFLPPALILILLGRIRRRHLSAATIAGLYAFLCVLSLMLPFMQILLAASVVLAAGAAVALARVVRGADARWRRRFRRGGLALLILVIAGGIGERMVRRFQERRALAALPDWPRGSPNVVLIILDTVRRANLHVYGYARQTTPRLEQAAREGVVFERAIASAPWTLPSHAGVFTGLSQSSMKADWRTPLWSAHPTLAEVLREHGYVTGGFVGNLLYTSWSSGLARGFVHYSDYVVSPQLVMLHSSLGRSRVYNAIRLGLPSARAVLRALRHFDLRKTINAADRQRRAESVVDSFLAWHLTTGPRPFFAFLNLFDAHNLRQAPAPWLATFGGDKPDRVDLYDGAVAYLDHEVGRLLDTLRQRGVLDRTIVIVTSDHGDQFGEHNLYSHGNSLYLPVLEVPLIVRLPHGAAAGRRVDRLATLRDLPATILDLAGIEDRGGIPGSSLAPLWRDANPSPTTPVFSELTQGFNVDSSRLNARGPLRSLLDERWHYIRNEGLGVEGLYAWRSDTLELANLADVPEFQPDLRRLRRQLDSALAEARRRAVP